MSDEPDVPRDPSLTALLQLLVEQALDGVRTMLPGKIVAYDDSRQIAVVQPLIQDRRLSEQGENELKTIPPVHDVPVMFCGPKNARWTFPVAVGDLCALWFSSSAISNFIAQGGGNPLDPGSSRRHDLSDAIAWVGLHSPASAPTDAPTDAVVLHLSGGIVLRLGGSGASNPAVLGSSWQSAFNSFLSALSTYATAIQSSADPSGTATTALGLAITAASSASYLSSTIFLS